MTQAHDRETDAIELLQRDHDEIRRLMSELAVSPAGTIPAGDHDLRGSTVEQLVICAARHEAIEEQYFWPVVYRRVRDGSRLADEALSQELQVKQAGSGGILRSVGRPGMLPQRSRAGLTCVSTTLEHHRWHAWRRGQP
jgi:Hemerythrin HHE cation binding domain